MGPRIDRFKSKDTTFISGHSIPHICLGGFILIFGFMAFNAGSKGSISNEGDGEAISVACLSTLSACSSGGITVLFIWKFHPAGGKWSVSRIINGCLSGMVCVCAGISNTFICSTRSKIYLALEHTSNVVLNALGANMYLVLCGANEGYLIFNTKILVILRL